MHPVFKCDYCKFMGTEEEVREHEPRCMDNYDRKSCYTCVHKKLEPKDGGYLFTCKLGREITAGTIFEFCSKYERKVKPDNILDGLFGGLFG